MKITIKRLYNDGDTTIGAVYIQSHMIAFSCEDEPREEKLVNETRIPAGIYPLGVRKGSPMAKRYDAKFEDHDGMLWIQGVPGFEYVYFHVGNDESDSSGCVLLGQSANVATMNIGSSVKAYEEFYSLVRPHIDEGWMVEVIDEV